MTTADRRPPTAPGTPGPGATSPADQQPAWPDEEARKRVEAQLSRAPAPRLRRRGPQPDRRPGRGRPGAGLPAPGRRLRRVLRRLLGRPDPGQVEGHPADGGRPHLRGRRPGGEGRPHRRPVREAPVRRRPRRVGQTELEVVPRPHGERRRLRPRGPPARPRAPRHRLPPVGGDPEPAARLHQRRLRRPDPGARVEPAVRRHLGRGPPLRAHRRRDRPRAAVHGRLRHRPRGRGGPAPGRLLDQPRGADPPLRGGAHPARLAHRQLGRLLGPHALGGRAHAAARRRPPRASSRAS